MIDAEQPVAWITGASRGIGKACAHQLALGGYHVALSSRNPVRLAQAVEEIGRYSKYVKGVPCDVRSERAVRDAHSEIVRTAGAVSVLINNAGVAPFSTFSETSIDEFDDVIAANLLGLFHTTQAVLPEMYERGEGVIVQMLSISAKKAFRGGAAYAASKFAALGYTECLREEARKHGVKVIAVFPGATETETWDERTRTEFHERMMQPEDIARAIAHVLAEPQRMMTEEIVMRPIGGDL